MSQAVYEFPLNEKVRNYLRLEQLFKRLDASKKVSDNWQFYPFFECLFTLLDLLERLDIRTDIIKDMDQHERNLVHWSQHPKIDTQALEQALKRIISLREKLKNARKPASGLKEDKLLASVKQRFNIPGGTCSFDLPNLHFWLNQPTAKRQTDINAWYDEFVLVRESVEIALSFLRERGRFADTTAEKGFYQGVAEDKIELIRVYCQSDQNYYPTLSGNKYRYVIRFMWFEAVENQVSVESDLPFKLACC